MTHKSSNQGQTTAKSYEQGRASVGTVVEPDGMLAFMISSQNKIGN